MTIAAIVLKIQFFLKKSFYSKLFQIRRMAREFLSPTSMSSRSAMPSKTTMRYPMRCIFRRYRILIHSVLLRCHSIYLVLYSNILAISHDFLSISNQHKVSFFVKSCYSFNFNINSLNNIMILVSSNFYLLEYLF